MEGSGVLSGAGSVLVTNESGRPKNISIRNRDTDFYIRSYCPTCHNFLCVTARSFLILTWLKSACRYTVILSQIHRDVLSRIRMRIRGSSPQLRIRIQVRSTLLFSGCQDAKNQLLTVDKFIFQDKFKDNHYWNLEVTLSAIINTDFTSDQVSHYYHSLKIILDPFGLHFIFISSHSSILDHIDHFSSWMNLHRCTHI